MSEETKELIFNIAMILLCISPMIAISISLYRRKWAPIKSVAAQVINKNKFETFSKYSPTGKNANYVIVFSINGKKKSFKVSEFSYDGYKVNEKGTLKYRGNTIISFD